MFSLNTSCPDFLQQVPETTASQQPQSAKGKGGQRFLHLFFTNSHTQGWGSAVETHCGDSPLRSGPSVFTAPSVTPDAVVALSPFLVHVPQNRTIPGAQWEQCCTDSSPWVLASLCCPRGHPAAHQAAEPIGLGCCQEFMGEERETFNVICMKVQEALNRVSAINAGYIAQQTGPIQV